MSPSVGLLLLVLLGLSQALSDIEEVPDDEDSVDITTAILSTNNASDENLFEGDLLFPTNRNLMMCWSGNRCRWPKSSNGQVVIPYVINNVFSSFEKDKIKRALQDFHTKTCIRFTPRVREYDYISLESRQGCYSAVGKSGGRQVVSLQKNGCMHKGIIQHELCHALGFQHEQTRSDRDQYIKIHWNNIASNMAHNFQKHRTINQETPYDYSSVMHYGKYAFARVRNQPTLTPYPDRSVPIGQRQAMSQWDITRINRAYSCN
ncbi:high choriolytic enzyme 1-like [Sphaeramia orbicularis]|uniref:high choriolytic enzyme 1-like n=1 Tax=Sphaeramia orbicularis TaxID=375764 RepID=UPI00118067AC|nr:high choriolytic enzyme 1-like [Sphaeramia orbicularis]